MHTLVHILLIDTILDAMAHTLVNMVDIDILNIMHTLVHIIDSHH